MRIAVIDGQGGGVGKLLVERIRAAFGPSARITALGTNAVAAALMLKAGADEGASGENAIVWNVPRVDVITGTIGIIAANSMMGELTPKMARAIAESASVKILIPVNRCGLMVAGVAQEPLNRLVEMAVDMIREVIEH